MTAAGQGNEVPVHTMTLGDLPLESGQTLRDCRIAYTVHNAHANTTIHPNEPVVLALCAIGTTHQRMDFLIGPGLALDPARCTVITINALGNGLSSSPSNSTCQPGRNFPRFTIRDMVQSQRLVLESLGIRSLHAVIGASMGGMQALQWAASFPERVRHVVAMTPMAATSSWSAAINRIARGLLCEGRDDADWEGWVALMQLVAGRTPESVDEEFLTPAAVQEWIRSRANARRHTIPSALDWVYQSWAYDGHDIGAKPGCEKDTATALARLTMPILVATPDIDLYNPVDGAATILRHAPGARALQIPSQRGHQSASAADPNAAAFLNQAIEQFLWSNTTRPNHQPGIKHDNTEA